MEVLSHLCPEVTPLNTYQHSNSYLDYILITPALIPALKSTGFLLFNILFLADHGSIYADFDEELLCQGELKITLDRVSRNLVAGNSKCRDRYCKLLNKYAKQHKFIEKMQHLYNIIKSGCG
eukprot:4802633-Ditylum_brightwellii.AAC.1